MTDINPTELDKTGKVVLDQIYSKDSPLDFYNIISQMDYAVPQQAKSVFIALIEHLQSLGGGDTLKLIDLGSSYGVNAALLKYNLSLDEVFHHYKTAKAEGLSRAELLALDHKLLEACQVRNIEMVGVDISDPALSYAEEAGLIDERVVGNFECDPMTPQQQERLSGADLIISTGCIGYVGAATVSEILDAVLPKQPWMAHFVLRTFRFDDVAEMAAARGYQTKKGQIPIRQRRFASSEEYESALSRLETLGIDPTGLEGDGWYYADLYLSRPFDACGNDSGADIPAATGADLPPLLQAQFESE
ncbi:MAG: methyltransferase type 12 [Rhodomicrobium sp.]|nr:MAG: methyltransferase type 12 [Rhodomicrobium sp.]